MISIVYEGKTNRIKEIHDYQGRARRFSQLRPGMIVWHVPRELMSNIHTNHDIIVFDAENNPIGTDKSYKHKERVQGIAVQTGGLWGLPNEYPQEGQIQVLFARFKGLGDVLMSWFALEEYRQQFPDKYIAYLTSPQAASLFCGQQGLVNRILYTKYEHDAKKGIVPLPIVARQYTEVYNMINQVDFGEIAYIKPRADNFADLLGVKIKSTYDEATEKYIPEVPIRQLQISSEEIIQARKLIEWNFDKRIAVLQLNSNGKPRQWFYWNKLAKKFIKDGYKVIYMSTDTKDAYMKAPRGVINLSCKTNIREYIAILGLAHILVCVDTSALHIGARLENLKVFPLFGSTGAWAHSKYYQNTYPIEGQALCAPCWDWQLDCCDTQKDRLICMKRITADMVMDRIKETL